MNTLPPELRNIINEYNTEPQLKIAIIGDNFSGKKSLAFKIIHDVFPIKQGNILQIDPTYLKTNITIGSVECPPDVSKLQPVTVQFSVINTSVLADIDWDGTIESLELDKDSHNIAKNNHDNCNKIHAQNLIYPLLKTTYDLIFLSFDSSLQKLTDNAIMKNQCMFNSLLKLPNFSQTPRWLILTKCDNSTNDGKWMQTAFECAQLVHIYDINGPIFLISSTTSDQINKMRAALLQYYHSIEFQGENIVDKENCSNQVQSFTLCRTGNALNIVH